MKIVKKHQLIALFLAIILFCFPLFVYTDDVSAGKRTVLAPALPPGDNIVGKVKLTDGTTTATINSQGHLDVTLDNQPLVLNRYAASFHGHTTTLSVEAAQFATSISIQGGDYASFAVGDRLFMFGGGTIEENNFPIITAKPGSPVLTLNKPLDFTYPMGSVVQHVVIDAEEDDGSLEDPIVYRLVPPAGVTFNIKSAVVTMSMTAAGDYSKFGDIDNGLTNGLVARAKIDEQIRTRTSARTNLDFEDDTMDPLVFHDKAGGGAHGLVATYILDKGGSFIPLNGTNGDFFEILVQDDISSLLSIRVKFHGYITINQ